MQLRKESLKKISCKEICLRKNSCTEKRNSTVSLFQLLLSKQDKQWTVLCETKVLVLARQIMVAKNRTVASLKRCTLCMKEETSILVNKLHGSSNAVDWSFRYLFTNHTEVHFVYLRRYTCLLKSSMFNFWYSTNNFNRYTVRALIGPGCSKPGYHYPPDKSLSSG